MIVMAELSARERMAGWGAPVVDTLEPAKAARLKAKTMLMPSPNQVRDAIATIPAGQTKTLKEVRREIADASGADMTCPVAARQCWRLVAEAAEEDRADGNKVAPWWRVTKDGKPDSRVPGGEANHRALLHAEGVQI